MKRAPESGGKLRAATQKRLCAVVLAFLIFAGYLGARDTIKVHGDVPRQEVKAAVAGLREWSSPKLFRHIEVYYSSHSGDEMVAQVREPGFRYSVTVFARKGGSWEQTAWFLCREDREAFEKGFFQRSACEHCE